VRFRYRLDRVGQGRVWVEDCYHDSYGRAVAAGSASCGGDSSCRRVVRGGSWLIDPVFLRSANRYWFTTDYRNNNLGFRLARTLAARACTITVAPGVR